MQYAVKLGLKGQVEKISNQDELPMADFIYQQVECSIFEKVNAKGLSSGYVLVVDEEGSFKELPTINPFGSWLYGFQEHGCPILGIALILKLVFTSDGPDFSFLNEQEADILAAWLEERRPIMMRDMQRAIARFDDNIIVFEEDSDDDV